MKKHKLTLIPGDGIGPEVTGAAISVMRAAGVQFEWDSFVVGAEALSRFGDPLPQDLIESIRRNKIALKGPVITPVGTGFVSANVRLRKALASSSVRRVGTERPEALPRAGRQRRWP